MTFTTVEFTRELNINELKEVLVLMENQETTDRYESIYGLYIKGDFAEILVDIDEYGNVTVL